MEELHKIAQSQTMPLVRPGFAIVKMRQQILDNSKTGARGVGLQETPFS